MSCPSTRLFTLTVLTGVTTPNALTYVPMSPFCAEAVAIITAGGAEPAFGRADCGCERFWKRRIPATVRIITIATTIHAQRRRLLSGGDVEGMLEDSADGDGCGVLRHEGLVLGDAIHKDGLVVNGVELVGDGSLDGNLDGARGKFGNDNADGSGSNRVRAIGLLQIERAAGVIIGLAAGIDRDGAVGRLGNRRANWGINFLIAAVGGLIVNAVVVIVRRPADLQGETTERQHRKAAAESKVTPVVPPMKIHVHVVMHESLVAGRAFAVNFDWMLGFTAHLGRPMHDLSIHVADAAMAGAVHHGGPGS